MSVITNENSHKKSILSRNSKVLICLFLIIGTLAVYGQVRTHDFINFDDDVYVTENHQVQAGLTPESITWAFTATRASNWHPLTWLSHMVDVQLFGMNPSPHHLTNLFFHVINTLLLFLVLRKMTGAQWKSAFVAALFALHPLHVESVAWVAERKDVLSTFFWMLTLWAYLRYVEFPGFNRYLLVLLFFALGLLAKPMLVTLPFVLLLLDYWPLGRVQFGRPIGSLLWEKVPLFVLTAASGIVTFLVQKSEGAVRSLIHTPFDMRVANALVSYVLYLGKMIWPNHLAVLYPHQGYLPGWQVVGAGLLLLGITFLAIRVVRRQPCVFVGWLWYLGTLVPVIGLVQVGSQAMADRYTYVPLIGIFIIIAWGVPELIAGWRYKKTGLATAGTIVLLILMITTWVQVRYWKDSTSLFKRGLEITVNNYALHNNLGIVLANQERPDEAVKHYFEALRLFPDYFEAHSNLANVLVDQGKFNDAVTHYLTALRIKPDSEKVYHNLGILYRKKGEWDEAIAHFQKALSIQPEDFQALNELALVYVTKKEYNKALPLYMKMIDLRPGSHIPYYNLACFYSKQHKIEESVDWLKKAVNRGFKNWDFLKTDEDLENIRETAYFNELIHQR